MVSGNPISRVHIVATGLMGGVGFLLLLIFLAYRSNDYSAHNDPYDLAKMGQSLVEGEGLTIDGLPYVILPPGFSAVVGFAGLFLEDAEWNTKMLSIAFFLASLGFLYRVLVYFLEDRRWAWLALLLYAGNSQILFNAASGRSESLYGLILFGMAYVGTRIRRPGLVWSGVLAAGTTALYYVRPEGLLAGAAWIVWFAAKWKGDRWQRLRHAGLITAIVILLVLPYLLFLKTHTGRWQLSGKTYVNLIMAELNSPFRDTSRPATPRYLINEVVQRDPTEARSVSEYLRDPEADMFRRIPVNMIDLLRVYWLTFSFGGLLVLFGFVRFENDRRMLLAALLIPMGIMIFFFVSNRIVAAYHWLAVLCFTNGLRYALKLVASRLSDRTTGYAGLSVVVLTVFYEMRGVLRILLDRVVS